MPIFTTKRKLDRLDKEYKEVIEYYESVDFNETSGGRCSERKNGADNLRATLRIEENLRVQRLLEEEGEGDD